MYYYRMTAKRPVIETFKKIAVHQDPEELTRIQHWQAQMKNSCSFLILGIPRPTVSILCSLNIAGTCIPWVPCGVYAYGKIFALQADFGKNSDKSQELLEFRFATPSRMEG